MYVDDLIVMPRTEKEALENLEIVLRRLEQANLKIKPSKCSLLQKSVEYLGHTNSS